MRKKEKHTHTQLCVLGRILFSDIMAVMVLRECYVFNNVVVVVNVFVCMKGDNIKLQLLLLEFIHL